MNEILQGKGLVNVAEDKVHVTGLKGPLEDGWQKKVEAFVTRILVGLDAQKSVAMAGVEIGKQEATGDHTRRHHDRRDPVREGARQRF